MAGVRGSEGGGERLKKGMQGEMDGMEERIMIWSDTGVCTPDATEQHVFPNLFIYSLPKIPL